MLSEAGRWVCSFGGFLRMTGAGQCQMLPVTGPWQPVQSYKVIHNMWQPLLGLCVFGKDQAMHRGQLLSAPGLGQVSKSSEVP